MTTQIITYQTNITDNGRTIDEMTLAQLQSALATAERELADADTLARIDQCSQAHLDRCRDRVDSFRAAIELL